VACLGFVSTWMYSTCRTDPVGLLKLSLVAPCISRGAYFILLETRQFHCRLGTHPPGFALVALSVLYSPVFMMISVTRLVVWTVCTVSYGGSRLDLVHVADVSVYVLFDCCF